MRWIEHFRPIIFCFLINCPAVLEAQDNITINPELLKSAWAANWIAPPDAWLREFGVFHFRKTFNLDAKPNQFIIHVSADNRYRLFINGRPVCFGPARGDLDHWRFETVDISPYLVTGKNLIAALVWNFGNDMPMAQISLKTAFILQGDTKKEWIVNTDHSWKVMQDRAYLPHADHEKMNTFMVVGPGENLDGSLFPWGWEYSSYTDSDWPQALQLGKGMPRGVGTGMNWVLEPRPIPMMQESLQRLVRIRKSTGIQTDEGFLRGTKDLMIPAHSDIAFLIDQDFNTTAYPELLVSGGKASQISLAYAEAMYRTGIQTGDFNARKGNRNDVDHAELIGFEDKFLPDGGSNRLFRPLWFRTYRYVEMKVKTEAEPLVIHDFHGIYTGYPFREKAGFRTDDPELAKIWEVGWRTARLCAHETYFDCPCYEQLQYVGDTRIQALISLNVTGDDRLMRNALLLFNYSRFPEGLTLSRYPTNIRQVIPTFSLFWIGMIHDYWMYRDDDAFVKSFLPGIEGVIDWYHARIDSATGMLGAVPYWSFVDWPDEWPWDNVKETGGVPPGADTGGSAITTLQLACTLKDAAELAGAYGKSELAAEYLALSRHLCSSTYKLCWDPSRQMLADTPDKKSFSQHANIMAVLSDAIPSGQQGTLLKRITEDKSLVQTTMYYKFYLVRAMKKAGLADQYLEMLGPWKQAIGNGLTTFPERPDPTRSDCHAWSASPLYDFLATVCGIEPASRGFKTVKIEPHPGTLNFLEASFPHPLGEIRMNLKKDKTDIWHGEIILPVGLKGNFRMAGRNIDLHEGKQEITAGK